MKRRRVDVDVTLLEEALKDRIDATINAMKQQTPDFKLLKSTCGCRLKDWNDYLSGFDHIKDQMTDCLLSEIAVYERRLEDHKAKAKQLFNVVCPEHD